MINRFNAFISYKHAPLDNRIAGTIQRDLERYVIPRRIRKQTGVQKIERVFRDQAELPITSDLDNNISFALEHSDYLIVICSLSTKLSSWVPREIECFLRFHPVSHVLTVLAEGEPADVIPEILRKRNVPVVDPDGNPVLDENGEPMTEEKPLEPLSCDYRLPRPQAKKRELPRLAAAIIGCSYDELIMRARQYRMRRLAILGGAAAVLMSVSIAYLLWSRAQIRQNYQQALINQSVFLSHASDRMLDQSHDGIGAAQLALAALGEESERPVTARAVRALTESIHAYEPSGTSTGRFPDGKYEMGSAIRDFEVDENSKYLFALDDSGEAAVFDILTQERLFAKKFEDAYIERMFVLPAGGERVLVCDGFTLFLFDWRSGGELWRLELWSEEGGTSDPDVAGAYKRYIARSRGMISPDVFGPVAAALSPDRKTLAVDGMSDAVQLIDMDSGMAVRTLTAGIMHPAEGISAWRRMVWSEDGRHLAAVYLDDTGDDTIRLAVFEPSSGTALLFDTNDPSFENLCFAEDTVVIMTRGESWEGSSLMAVPGLEGYGSNLFPSSSKVSCFSISGGRLLWTQELPWHAPWKNCGQIRLLRLKLSGETELFPVIACSASNMAYLLDVNDGTILCSNEHTDSVIAIMDYTQVLMILRNGDSTSLNYNGPGRPDSAHTQLPHFISTSTPYEIEKVIYGKNEEGAAYYCLSPGSDSVIRFRRVWDRDGVAYEETGIYGTPSHIATCGRYLIICRDREELLCYDTLSGQLAWCFRPEESPVSRIFVLQKEDQYRIWVSGPDRGEETPVWLIDPETGSPESFTTDRVPVIHAGDSVFWIDRQTDGSALVRWRSFSDDTYMSAVISGVDIPEEPVVAVSSDGKRIGISSADRFSFWQADLESGETKPVSQDIRTKSLFVWSEDGSAYATTSNTGIMLCDTDGKTLTEIPTEGRYPVGMSIKDDVIYVLYRGGNLFLYRRPDASVIGTVDLGLETDESPGYSFALHNGLLYLQASGDSRWLAVVDIGEMELECLVENAVGYYPDTGKILVGTVNSSTDTWTITAFDHYTPAQLREKARAFIGGNTMSEEMKEQYGISG